MRTIEIAQSVEGVRLVFKINGEAYRIFEVPRISGTLQKEIAAFMKG